jgi:hypothetical protein
MTRIKASSIIFLRSREEVIAPANLYLDSNRGLSTEPNGEVIAEVSESEGSTLQVGPLYISPEGALSTEPNGKAIAEVIAVDDEIDENRLSAVITISQFGFIADEDGNMIQDEDGNFIVLGG